MISNNIINISSNLIIMLSILVIINRVFTYEINNISNSIKKSAFILSFSIAAISTVITDNSVLVWYEDLLYFLLDIGIIVVLLFISLKVNDKLILHNIDNNDEISKNNISVAIVEAGSLLATSLILFASMYGNGSYLSGFVFFALGQVSLFFMIVIYNKITKFDILVLVKQNNISMAILLFSLLIGFAIVLCISIFGDSYKISLADEIKYYLQLYVIYGFVLLIFLNKIIDKLLFKSFNIHKDIINDNSINILQYSIIKLSIILLIAFIINTNI